MKFTKMHGAGNDYIYVNGFEETIENPSELSLRISDRHFGIGGDGLVVILPSDKADFRMAMYNADGSQSAMCGNATRCIAKFVYDNKMTNKTDITLETLSGIKKIKVYTENGKVKSATVNMGAPILKPADIPVLLDGDNAVQRKVQIGSTEQTISCVSMGNPHCVVFGGDPELIDIEKIGPLFENDKLFPERTNTEFIQLINKNTLKMRVWERGSGETLACGTGACAAAVAAILSGFCEKNSEIKVLLRGGELNIRWAQDGDVYMTGPAETVFTGEIELQG